MKLRSTISLGLAVAALGFSTVECLGQAVGSRGGVTGGGAAAEPQPLDPDVVGSYITVEGKAELRLQPTRIRIVLAVTSEGETSKECSANIRSSVDELNKSWRAIGIAEADINEDFIAILPHYGWKIEDRNGESAGVEHKVGYRMQSNMHVAVADEAKAHEVLEAAYEAGVTDIIAFDYWSAEIDVGKVEARKTAMLKAREKAETLLELFAEKPEIINVQEQTRTYFPKGLYESFENAYDSSAQRPSRRDVPFFGAYRPKNTYYRGLEVEADARSAELAMKPEISVVSTVRIYYRSPAADDDDDGEEKADPEENNK